MKKLLGFCFIVFTAPINAASTTGLPWEGPIQIFQRSLSGPVAMGIAVVAIFAAAGALIFGSDLTEFTRKFFVLIIVIAVLLGASSILSTLFGATGAVIY